MDWWSIAINALSLVLVAVQGLLAWGLWSLRKQFVGQEQCGERCQAMAKTQAELAQAQAKLEQAQKALPDAAEVQAMAVQLAEIEGSIKAVAATVQGQAEIMQRIERPLNLLLEHHLRGDK
jgi:cellobiose-specific phosphotransferase system component IIA